MKTRNWILIFTALVLLCGGLSVWLFRDSGSAYAVEVWSDGVLVDTLPLNVTQNLKVDSPYGYNKVTVKDGYVAVTEATCPDHYCMKRGFCDGGAQIVCLPNRLVLKFVGEQEVDFVVG